MNAKAKIVVRNAELNDMEMDMADEDQDMQIRQALDYAPAGVHFYLTDGRRVSADSDTGRRIVEVLYR